MNDLIKTYSECDDSTKVAIMAMVILVTFIVSHSIRRAVESLSPYEDQKNNKEDE